MFSCNRRPKFPWILAVFLGLIFLTPASVRAQEAGKAEKAEKTFLWKVSSSTNTIYVLGSMHLANKDFFPLPAEIEEAFAKSKKLVVEADTENVNQIKVQLLVIQKGLYPKGESLSKALSKKTMDALREYCKNNKGTNLAVLEQMRPWLATLTISVAEIQAAGLNPESGIDTYFLKKAKKEKKPIVELESVEGQLDLFAGLSPELQETMLAKTIESQGDFKATLGKISEAWKKGDVKAMEQQTFGDTTKKHPEYKGLMVKMFDDRNVKMVAKIEEFLKGNEPVFVVVGAGHLVGAKGIVKLLRDKDYQVTQVTRAAVVKKAS